MGERSGSSAREDFHAINNLLNKITTHAGMAKYNLEEKGIDADKLEEEATRLIKIFDGMEENAMTIAQILKRLRKEIDDGKHSK